MNMLILFLLLACCQLCASISSFLYRTGLNGEDFKTWVLKKKLVGKVIEETVAHNFTSQVDLHFNDQTIDYYVIYSPIIRIAPAWRISYKVIALQDTVPITCPSCMNIGSLFLTENKKPHDVIASRLYNPSGFVVSENVIQNDFGIETEYKYGYFLFKLRLANAIASGIQYANVTSFEITYINCPEIVNNLAKYNNTPAARDAIAVQSKGDCIPNAEEAPPYGDLLRFCDKDGKTVFKGECWCSKGYERNNIRCDVCPAEHFQPTTSAEKCKQCGVNTDVVEARTKCRCKDQTFRFKSEQEMSDKDCYTYPSSSNSIESQATNVSLTLKWNAPSFNGSFDNIFYRIICQTPVNYGNCPADVISHSTSNPVVFKDLLSHTQYTFLVCTHNNVSFSNMYETASNCKEHRTKTADGLPTKVTDFKVTDYDQGFVSFSWKEPKSTGSDDILYQIYCNGGNTTVRNTNFKAFRVMTSTNEIQCSITPKSVMGAGEYTTLKYVIKDLVPPPDEAGDANTAAIAGGVIAAIVVLILLACIIYYLFKRQKDKQHEMARDLELILQSIDQTAQSENLRLLLQQRQRNIYVPLDIVLNQSLIDLNSDGPIYEDIPVNGYDFQYSKLEFLQKLGEGNFAYVHLAEAWDICGSSGKSTVAVKVLKDDCDEVDRDDFKCEIELMKELKKHHNVIQLLGVSQTPVCMLVEYVPGGDLSSFLLKSRRYRDPEYERTRLSSAEGSFLNSEHMIDFAYQIANGMHHLSSHNIVHRDLACRNILVGYRMVCKIADLGLARKLNDQGIYKREKQAKLPVKWLPPESIKFARSSIKSDVWSYGILLWEIVTIGGVPYPGYRSKDVPKLLIEGYRMPRPEHCTDELFEIISHCWSELEDDRPSFYDLFEIFKEMKDSTKTYINLADYHDEAYLPLDDDVFAEGDEVVFMEGEHNDKNILSISV